MPLAPGTVTRVIGYLEGTVRPGGIVVTGGGVGYLVHTPSALVPGDFVELHVATLVREDAITLYGFASVAERAFFDALRAVQGVGPAAAVALLRDLGVTGLVAAVATKDIKALRTASGVGPKMAENVAMLVKLPDVGVDIDGEEFSDMSSEVVDTLQALGFDAIRARHAVSTALADGVEGEAELLRMAIAGLHRSAA